MKFFISTFVLALFTAAFKPVASKPADGRPEYSGNIVVVYRPTANRAGATSFVAEKLQEARDEGISDCDLEPVYSSGNLFDVFHVGEGNEGRVMEKLKGGMNYFASIQPDYIYALDAVVPDDPLLSEQYTLDVMNMYAAWDISTGTSEVTIGICDTGIDIDHPDLLPNMLEGYDALTQTWGGDFSTRYDNDHGTAVAGSAAAFTNNAIGIAGMGWNLKHRSGQVQTAPGFSSSSVIADCLLKMCQKDDVRVVNVSFSGVYDTVRHAVARQCKYDYNTLVVNSAGNSDLQIYGDAELDHIIFVGATNSDDERASFSNYGALVDVWAPGRDIYTTREGGLYGDISGTSFSSPIVAGVIGLIWSTNPGLTPDEVEAILKESCNPLASLDGLGGHGRVDAEEALKLATGITTLAPTSAPECNEEIEIEFVNDEWGEFDNVIALSNGMDITHVRNGDKCYTVFTDTFSGLCTDTNYNVMVTDSYGDGWFTCGNIPTFSPYCTASCQPPYVKGTWNGQTLFHLTAFDGSYVGMDFTLPKPTKSSKSAKSSRVRALR
eukprot:CAMPEP_0116134610 /NCGR_PEP_ID=MMETSP0329-20121206/10743_1 /TAXON_ID=697910 /ORGANISM="Pseudo-nitzschia arenysensis, Strain B593" /LENGTH=549 /DNA_ID=CAMNT_0003629343 /DNA_START=165 /DNA_END=1814 /DNA_ORIENTATION=+